MIGCTNGGCVEFVKLTTAAHTLRHSIGAITEQQVVPRELLSLFVVLLNKEGRRRRNVAKCELEI